MKKIFSIIVIILLFAVASLIFWSGLAPANFLKFFEFYPVVNRTAVEIGIISPEEIKIFQASSSEAILGVSGKVLINGNTWNVEVARDELTKANGLSNRVNLYRKTGMLFVFDKSAPQHFWMKDMLIPLDIVFFDSNWQIVLIESDMQPNSFPKIFGNNVNSQYILEINALEAKNYDLKVGDQAIFLNK